ncbi:MAG: peptidoglycan D,D-transpeptidase FtsI family protein [Solirubrobacterales bacterium]
MNTRIRNLFGLVVVLFTVLIGFTSYWSVFDADELEANPANKRPLLEEQQIRRGLIFAADGTVLARSRGKGNSPRFYERVYPEDALFGHPVGYSFVERGRVALEREYNDELTGKHDELHTIFDELRGKEREGDDIVTTLDPAAQRTAIDALGGRAGAVVALEPATGRVRTMVSVPAYDPNSVPERFSDLRRAPGSPLLNRSVQSGYPPGSTFKVVTATAALDSGRYTPQSFEDGRSPKEIGGVPLTNFGGTDFGRITLTDALTNSVNTVWATVGEELGKRTMYSYMRRYGFNRKPLLDLPRDEMRASGVYDRDADLLSVGDAVDIGRVAIGQERLQVTPLQMALVPAAVANGGSLMRPHIVREVRDRDGRVVRRVKPSEQSAVMKPGTASELARMMSNVVEEGTGTAAALEGIEVAGKTGTAEVGTVNQAWFIAFAPVQRPRVAIAVTVERTTGQGGTVAAPIAKQVMQELLR